MGHKSIDPSIDKLTLDILLIEEGLQLASLDAWVGELVVYHIGLHRNYNLDPSQLNHLACQQTSHGIVLAQLQTNSLHGQKTRTRHHSWLADDTTEHLSVDFQLSNEILVTDYHRAHRRAESLAEAESQAGNILEDLGWIGFYLGQGVMDPGTIDMYVNPMRLGNQAALVEKFQRGNQSLKSRILQDNKRSPGRLAIRFFPEHFSQFFRSDVSSRAFEGPGHDSGYQACRPILILDDMALFSKDDLVSGRGGSEDADLIAEDS